MKKSRMLGALCAVLLAAIPYSTAHAISIQLVFSVTGFTASQGGSDPAPDETVSGSFLYEAASIYSTIDSLTGINLTIGGHAYSLGEVGFDSSGSGLVFQCISENSATDCSIGGSGRDFILEWTPHNNQPKQFAYTVADENEFWAATDLEDFTVFSITAVPIPPALLLFGSGLVGLTGIARRKKSA